MSKVLYAASVPIHLANFHRPYIQKLIDRGDEVWTLCSGDFTQPGTAGHIDFPLKKSMGAPGNFLSALRLAGRLRRSNFDLICVHTSLAAFFLRLALRFAGKGETKLINTVHGYLFDEGTPFLKRSILLLAEMLHRGMTDRVVVMNASDKAIAEKHRLGKEVVSIPGMGVDFSRLHLPERAEARRDLGLGEGDLLLLYPAEFSPRKNQGFLIRALKKLPENVFLALPGEGRLLDACRGASESAGMGRRVLFPGQVSDLGPWLSAADICVSASRYEGLPFNIMEGMYAGRCVVASRVKGHTDLIREGAGGFLYGFGDEDEFCDCIRTLSLDPALRAVMGEKNRASVARYGRDTVAEEVFAALTMLKEPVPTA